MTLNAPSRCLSSRGVSEEVAPRVHGSLRSAGTFFSPQAQKFPGSSVVPECIAGGGGGHGDVYRLLLEAPSFAPVLRSGLEEPRSCTGCGGEAE